MAHHRVMSSTDVVVRAAEVDDAEGIAAVHVGTWQVAYRGLIPDGYLDSLDVETRAERWRSSFDQPDPSAWLMVAASGGAIIGFTSFGPSRDEDASEAVGEVWAIYVDPGSWGIGAGRALMDSALAALATGGFAEATLWVLSGNARAIAFYEAAGFASDGADKVDESRGFALHEVRYRRPLPSA